MNPLLFAVFAAFILAIPPLASAQSCDTGISKTKTGNCEYSADAIDRITKEFQKYKDTAGTERSLDGLSKISRNSGESLRKIKSVKQYSDKCSEDIKQCKMDCKGPPDRSNECKMDGSEDRRSEAEKEIEGFSQQADKAEKSAKTGGEGGGMPEMPKPPEDKKEENADKSCGGSTPDPSCPPKDDVCFKDPNSVACLCQAGLGTADVCKRAETKTERDKGGTDNESLGGGGGGGGGGKSATYADEIVGADPARVGPRGGGFSGGGGGGRSGGLGGLSAGGGGAGLPELPGLQKLSDAPSGGGGSYGSGGNSRFSPSMKKPKSYEKMLARGMAIVQRRLAGGSAGEIGASHGNLFESVSRAYRLKASSLRK